MMRISALVFCTILGPLFSFAQGDLVDISFVNFHSVAEKKAVTDHFRKAQSDNFILSIASGNLMNDSKVQDAKTKLQASLAAYRNDKFLSRKNDKKVRQIYEDVHKTYLKKFEQGSSFEDIFFSGNYDNVSASLLYALIFEELGIPYSVKEEPGNVYLLVYPESDRIKVEATSPLNGIMMMNDLFKEQYVKSLKEQKIISNQEAGSQSIETLFDKYYYGNQQNITFQNLLGLQYLEDAERNYQQQTFDVAYAQSEKAYLFYPCPKTSYFLMVTGSQAFQARKQLDSLKALQLAKLSRYKDQGITNEMITGEFINAIQQLLFEKGKKDDLEVFYRVLSTHVENIELQNELTFLFNYESGRYVYNQGKFRESLPLFEKALTSKPEKQDAINALISSLASSLSASTNNIETLKALEEYSKKYPSLHSSDVFNNIVLSAYLIQVAMEYSEENHLKGEKYRSSFEELKNKYPNVMPNAELIGEAYSRAAVYFYRKGQTTKAKSLIDTGLKFSPGNYELMTRKRMIH